MRLVADRLGRDRHYHHRHCVHNLSADEQRGIWRERAPDPDMYELIYGNVEPVVITPEEWEIDVPDVDWSLLDAADE